MFLSLSFFFILIFQVFAQRVEKDTKDYFESDLVKKCEEIWSKYRVGFEDALSKALMGYGKQSMNLYIRRPQDALVLTNGYYHSDNQVEMFFHEMLLQEFPHLIDPELEFDLCSNVIKISTIVSPMIIHAPYTLFRNKSDIIFTLNEQKEKNSSPFRFEQVQNVGSISITADRCFLTGQVLIIMDDPSVTVKHSSVGLSNCDFDIEVFTEGQMTPPVTANYLFDDKGLKLQDLLSRIINNELLPHLQSALFTLVNVSSIFGDQLKEMEVQQNIIFAKAHAYSTNVLTEVNNYVFNNDLGSVRINDFQIHWDDSFDGQQKNCSITLTDMQLHGLETAYTAHVGGPFKMGFVHVMGQVKIGSLKVLGKVGLTGIHDDSEYNFAADIYDAAIDVILDGDILEQKLQSRKNEDVPHGHVFKVVGWRAMDFSSPGIEQLPIEAIVTGYLLTEVPKYITEPLSTAFMSAIKNVIVDKGEDHIGAVPDVPDRGNSIAENTEEDTSIEYSEGIVVSGDTETDQSDMEVRKRRHRRHRRHH